MNCDKVTPVENCDCPIKDGGWCIPHQIHKNAHYVKLCRTRPKYRKAWNECNGPLQNIEKKQDDPLRHHMDYGPGTELRRALGCNRKKMVLVDFGKMNRWGVEGCREFCHEIIGWLVNYMELPAAERLVNITIEKAAKKALNHGN